jgi:membrane associated rhomboid family serine protease
MKSSLSIALMIVASFWAVFILNAIIGVDFNQFGIVPRNSDGIKGILFAPFLHGSFQHIVSNTFPMLVLSTALLFFYRKIAVRILILSTIMGGLLVWIFGRTAFHIGASGVIFALVGFLIASGIFRKRIKALLVAIAIFLLYGGIVWGVLPSEPGVSWESHMFGFLSGIVLAYVFRKSPDQ